MEKFNAHLGIKDENEKIKFEEQDKNIDKANLKEKLNTLEKNFQKVYDEYSNKYNKYVDKIKKINKTRKKVIEHCQKNLVEENFWEKVRNEIEKEFGIDANIDIDKILHKHFFEEASIKLEGKKDIINYVYHIAKQISFFEMMIF